MSGPKTDWNRVVDPAQQRVEGAARRFLRRFLSRPLGVAALCVILLMILIGVFAPLLAPYDPAAIDIGNRYLPPSPAHWLGTDDLGRDVLSRLLYAT
ncbi:MAG: ABC transporter, partial [Microbacteriaceae bacterium]|nr:ABC transporter [Microbacteriaceae bacterium]